MSHLSTRQIAKNVVSSWGGVAVSVLLSFFAAPFIVRQLGNSAYGVWVLMGSIAGYLSLLDFGVRGAITRHIARFSARGEDEEASRTATAALQLFMAMGVLAIVVPAVLAFTAIDRFAIPAEYREAAQFVFVLVGINVGVSLIAGAYGGIVAACNRIDLNNLVDVVIAVLRTGLTVGILFAGYGLVTMAAVHAALSVVRCVWLASLSRRLYPALHYSLRRIATEHFRLIFSFSIYSFLIHISGRLIYYTDALIIAAFLPVSLLTFFAVGGSLVDYARMLISSVSVATSPVASTLDGIGNYDRVRTLLINSARFSMAILLPIAVTFIVRGDTFIGLWMGPAYAATSGRVLAILALPLLFHGGSHGIGGIMLGLGKHKPMVPAMLGEAAANVVVSIALIQTMGIEGAAWGTAIPSVASSLFFWPLYTRRAVEIPLTVYIKEIWLRPWIAMVPFMLLTVLIDRFWTPQALWMFFAQVSLCVAPTVAMFWWVFFTPTEREALLAKTSRAFRRRSGEESVA